MIKKKRFSEWVSIMLAKKPAMVILLGILLLNVVFVAISAVLIYALAPAALRAQGMGACVYYTVSMILDAGFMAEVVQDVGVAGYGLIIACIAIVVIGSIIFTGAVIGYVTNYISTFIGSSNAGERRLRASNHTVILNWNSRASEIVNDMLYSEEKEIVVVLVSDGRQTVEKEIHERLANTLEAETRALVEHTRKAHMGALAAWRYIRKHRLRNRVTVIVREGDTFSNQKLNDISIKQAETVIILGKDVQNSTCKYETAERLARNEKGNTDTIKTLIQVAELTGKEDSKDNQRIVVETEDDWTLNLVNQIIRHKEHEGKCNIVPLAVNRVLGQILSQFSIMPELNTVYGELFSNKGSSFYSIPVPDDMTEDQFVAQALAKNRMAIPMTVMPSKGVMNAYLLAQSEGEVDMEEPSQQKELAQVQYNPDYWMEKRYIVILGHNSKSGAIMAGFNSFGNEWNYRSQEMINSKGGKEILSIFVIDDEKSLEKMNYYKDYPQVVGTLAADIYDKEKIISAITEFADSHDTDTSVLVLSDDSVTNEEMDANALTYLIYIQEMVSRYIARDPNFVRESIDVVVEIINPKNYDIVRSYDIDNIVISNRYLSKMITQIGEKDHIYNFYKDILTYDDGEGENESKELYAKTVGRFLKQVPGKCTVGQLIRGVYAATPEGNKAVVLGYARMGEGVTIFGGDQDAMTVELRADDKLILFSNH